MSGVPSQHHESVDRVLADVAHLAELSAASPGVTRLAYSAEDAAARDWFVRRASALGLNGEVDHAGNCFGWSRGALLRPAALLGSHLDSVPSGGRYDGVLGVVIGLEVARILLGRHPDIPIGVVAFACEESSRFGIGAVGSRILMGDLEDADLDRLRDREGRSLRSALKHAGLGAGACPDLSTRAGAFFEVHIDQGSAMASAGQPVAIVTALAGVVRVRFRFEGEASHSGAHTRSRRRDALLAASSFVVALDELWKGFDGSGGQTALTVGHLNVSPNSPNTVAGEVDLTVDIRAGTSELLTDLSGSVRDLGQRAAAERGVACFDEDLGRIEPVAMDRRLVAALGVRPPGAAPVPEVLSLAGHDAGVVAKSIPTTMVFVANPTGLSHNPDEAADPKGIAEAVELLVEAIGTMYAPAARAGAVSR